MHILNDVYNLELVNANDIKINFPAIDLIDTKNKIAFQVTSETSANKVKKDTIEKFNNLVNNKMNMMNTPIIKLRYFISIKNQTLEKLL